MQKFVMRSLVARKLDVPMSRGARAVAPALMSVLQRRNFSTPNKTYANIIVETRDKVALITLNRPKALNALNSDLMYVLPPQISASVMRPLFYAPGAFWLASR